MSIARLDQLLKMLELEPHDNFLNHALGVEYAAAGNFNEAVSVFEQLLARDENYLASYYQLGQALEKISNNEKAIEVYKKGLVIAKKQNNSKAMNELNEALWMLED